MTKNKGPETKTTLAVKICLQLNRMFRPAKGLESLKENPTLEGRVEHSRRGAAGHFVQSLDYLRPDARSQGRILDLGCGYGGLAALLSEKARGTVVGLNINGRELAAAKASMVSGAGAASNGNFVQGDAEILPFRAESFDTIYSIAAMEHFDRPADAVEECRRVLRRNGRFYVRFSTYYAHNGAHLFDFIHIPWCHLLFSEKTLVRAWKRLSAGNPELAAQNTSVDAENLRLAGLNRITAAGFKRVIGTSGFKVLAYRENTYGRWYFRILQKIPLIKELVTMDIVALLGKTADPGGSMADR